MTQRQSPFPEASPPHYAPVLSYQQSLPFPTLEMASTQGPSPFNDTLFADVQPLSAPAFREHESVLLPELFPPSFAFASSRALNQVPSLPYFALSPPPVNDHMKTTFDALHKHAFSRNKARRWTAALPDHLKLVHKGHALSLTRLTFSELEKAHIVRNGDHDPPIPFSIHFN